MVRLFRSPQLAFLPQRCAQRLALRRLLRLEDPSSRVEDVGGRSVLEECGDAAINDWHDSRCVSGHGCGVSGHRCDAGISLGGPISATGEENDTERQPGLSHEFRRPMNG